jgi:predicted RNA methylase
LHLEFLQLTDIFFSETSTWHEKREAILSLHHLFVQLGAIDASNREDTEPHTWLASGFAINPISAAICMLEVRRTIVFATGLKNAIAQRIKDHPGKTVRVLDAGCGPYALLCLLTTPFFSAHEVQFTVLDVFHNNINSIKTLVKKLSLENHFCSLLETDAATYQVPPGEEIHIAISETMKPALFKEPQTSITLNIARQLPADGVFIPEQITVDLRMVHRRLRNEWRRKLVAPTAKDHAEFETTLGEILQLTRYTKTTDVEKKELASFVVPITFHKEWHHLELFTTIVVYKDLVLERGQSSITLPIPLAKHYEDIIRAGNEISFWYELSGNPGLRFRQC